MNLLSFAMAGMVPTPSSGSGDGNGKGNGNTPPGSADITIVVDALAGPKAEPESAWVAPGGEVVWTCAEPFEIVLKILWSGERVSRKSDKAPPDGPHQVRVTAGSKDGRYSYGIAAGGKEVDPDVIIGPRMNL